MSEDKPNLLQELNDWLNSEECEKALELERIKDEHLDSLRKRNHQWLSNLSLTDETAFNSLVEKVIAKYASDAYKDRWYNRGIEPPMDLLFVFWDFARSKGEIYEEGYEEFCTSSCLYGDWIVKRYDGQGSFIDVQRITDDERKTHNHNSYVRCYEALDNIYADELDDSDLKSLRDLCCHHYMECDKEIRKRHI